MESKVPGKSLQLYYFFRKQVCVRMHMIVVFFTIFMKGILCACMPRSERTASQPSCVNSFYDYNVGTEVACFFAL